ncbi:hypothetical protein JCM6882_002771 [Rhodosporidiobolus microsporus]
MPFPAPSTATSEIFDLLTVGFGPASLAIAIALAEHNSNAPCPAQPTYSSLGGLQDALGFDSRQAAAHETAQREGVSSEGGRERRTMKVGFVEKHERFRWHPGMMIEGSTMQISFLKDLATLRNPQSAYTFLSYLASFSPSRLVSFVSLSTFTPSRREFADYLQWCAEKVGKETEQQGGTISYGEEVVAVEALRQDELPAGEEGDVRILRVTSRKTATGEVLHRLTRNLVVSTGGSPRMPPQLSTPDLASSPRILHTSSFVERIDSILSSVLSSPPSTRPLRFAVVGAGQSSAECFLALRSRLAAVLPRNTTTQRPQIDMLFRSSSLRPTDEGAFSNEVFDPAMSQAMFRLEEGHRRRVLAEAKATNYSIVNPKKLEELYEAMYAQKLEEDIAARSSSSASNLTLDPRLNLKPFSELVAASVNPSSTAITLTLHNPILSETREVEYDAVICGTGYDRQAWRQILFPAASSAADVDSGKDAIPLGELFSPASSPSHGEDLSPPLYTPPTLDLPETAFESRRLYAASSLNGDLGSTSSSSRSPSSARESSVSSTRQPSTAASSPPTPGSPDASREKGNKVQDQQHPYPVAENYRLLLPERTSAGARFRPTVWMQGSCEKTHGISDSLLSVLAVRSGEVVQSILREGWFGGNSVEGKRVDSQAA